MVENQGRIYLELPIEKEFARLLRLLVSGVASRMDFDLDAVDDLKIAVEEAFLTGMRRKVVSPIKVSFMSGEDSLTINFRGDVVPGASEENPVDDFSNFILEAVVDELTYGGSDTEFDLSIIKRIEQEGRLG